MRATTDQTDHEDFAFLLENAKAARRLNLVTLVHLEQPIGIWNYIRIANEIATRLTPGAHVLDWGCGYGQMTYLLERRGYRVTSYDVRDVDERLPDLPLTKRLNRIVSQEPVTLPFANDSLDAVLSCGVFEHIDEYSQPGNEARSLSEIYRILKSRGRLMMYQLPQNSAWQEAVIRVLKLGYAHPRRYHAKEITAILRKAGFNIAQMRRANLIPKNLTGMPGALRRSYSKAARPLIHIDGVVSQAPLLRKLAGVFEIDAVKRQALS